MLAGALAASPLGGRLNATLCCRMTNLSLPRVILLTAIVVFVLSFAGCLYLALSSGQNRSPSELLKVVVVPSAALTLFTVALVAAFGAWFGILANLFKMARSRKPGVSAFDHRLLFNPFNAVFVPRYLTDDGLVARDKLLRYVLIFVLAIAGGFGVQWLLRLAT